jgi:hypothetical protein
MAARSRRGGALAAALVVVTLMAMLSAAMLTLRGSVAKRQLGALDAKRAFYIAEAGLAEGSASLTVGGNGNVGSPDDPARFGDGIFWTEALVPLDGYTQINSTGMCGSGRCTLQLVVRNSPDPIGSLGLFGDQSVTLGKSAKVCGYDSAGGGGGDGGGVLLGKGHSEWTSSSTPARVASNGPVTLAAGTRLSPTIVGGDIVPGPGYSVTAGINTTITGSTAPGAEPEILPEIAVPTLTPIGSYVAKGGGTKVLPSSQGRYTTIQVQAGTVLSIAGPATIRATTLSVAAGATLRLDTTLGAIEIYVDDDLILAAGSSVTCPNAEAKSCTIYHLGDPSVVGTTPTATLAANGSIYAKVYAPHLALTLPASLDVYGALVAKSVDLGSNAEFRYDAATADSGSSSSAATEMPAPVAWQLLELPEAVASLGHCDPLKALGLEGDDVVLRRPADAHAATEWLIKYHALDGQTYTYVGKESLFDYAKVATVVHTKSTFDADFTATVRRLLKK